MLSESDPNVARANLASSNGATWAIFIVPNHLCLAGTPMRDALGRTPHIHFLCACSVIHNPINRIANVVLMYAIYQCLLSTEY